MGVMMICSQSVHVIIYSKCVFRKLAALFLQIGILLAYTGCTKDLVILGHCWEQRDKLHQILWGKWTRDSSLQSVV